MTSIPLIFRHNTGLFCDLVSFKHLLALRSCIFYEQGYGTLWSKTARMNYMLSKKIKLFCNYIQHLFLVTENLEYYFWKDDSIHKKGISNDGKDCYRLCIIHYFAHMLDWSNTRIKKCVVNYSTFLMLTEDEEIYYSDKKKIGIYQMIFKKKITCFGCGYNFYVIATDDNRTYSWGLKISYPNNVASMSKYKRQLCEVIELSGKTIVQIACGYSHAFVLTDKGEVYTWDSNKCSRLDITITSSSMMTIVNERIFFNIKISDIAVMKNISVIRSSDGLIYMWGFLSCRGALEMTDNFILCEYTNIFDISNTTTGQSPISMNYVYTDEDISILSGLTDIFNDSSTSDLTIKIKDQSIYVHKTILKIRSSYFRRMFQDNWLENNQCIMICRHHSYIVYVTFLRYLYTGMIKQPEMSSMENLLDLLKLADEYCENNLERDCIWMIKKKITVLNVILVNNVAMQYNKKELEEYCFHFFMKNMTTVMKQKSFKNLDLDTKKMFKTKHEQYLYSQQLLLRSFLF